MTEIIPFVYEDGQDETRPQPVRVVMRDGEPWFVAADRPEPSQLH